MNEKDATRVRLGLACLVASGVLSVIGLTLRGPIIDPGTAAEAFARGAASPSFAAAWFFLLLSLAVQGFGWLAL